MPLISDFVITPDVFDLDSYSSEEVCRVYLKNLEEGLTAGGFVRDLGDGQWSQYLLNRIGKESAKKTDGRKDRNWHFMGRDIIGKLVSQGRLISYKTRLESFPNSDNDWCKEALRTHKREPLVGGVVVTEKIKKSYESEKRVQQIDRLFSDEKSKTKWWWSMLKEPSVQLDRSAKDYEQHLAPILRFASFIKFFDPHLDFRKKRYKVLLNLLIKMAKERKSEKGPPKITIHRSSSEGSGSSLRPLDRDAFRRDFEKLTRPIHQQGLETHQQGLEIEVFFWDNFDDRGKFHDRFLISSLVSAILTNGFDTDKGDVVWSRMGNQLRSKVEGQFQKNGGRYKLAGKFKLPEKA